MRRWSAGAVLPGPDAKVHHLSGSLPALYTPTEDTATRHIVLHQTGQLEEGFQQPVVYEI